MICSVGPNRVSRLRGNLVSTRTFRASAASAPKPMPNVAAPLVAGAELRHPSLAVLGI